MALPTRTFDEILRRTLAFFRTSFPGFPLGVKKFLGRVARAFALVAFLVQKALEDLDLEIVPNPRMSTDRLSEWAEKLGLPDGEGGYGRRKPVAASGGVATLTGDIGTIYPAGATALAEDGETEIELVDEVTIAGTPPGSGSVSDGVSFNAVTKGTAGNLPAGTVCTWTNPPTGADATFVLTSALGDGLDTEDNAELYARIITRLQTPPRGGAAEDYRQWAAVEGITDVWVYGRRSGTGTVDVVVGTGGTGTGRQPADSLRVEASENIAANRPVGVDSVNTLVPYMPNDEGKLVRIAVDIALDKYDFDWDDSATTYTVDTYTGGASPILKLNTLAPASLKAAIDAYQADNTQPKPRLQVLSTGSVVNEPVEVVDYTDVDGNTKTELELDTLSDAWIPPTAGDTVLAYGPVVATIAAGVVALANTLGPSRESGYADRLTPWQDKLTISAIVAVAENAIDTDGTKLIDRVPVGGATINGVAADVTPSDDTSEAPELLYLLHVAVTRA